MSERTESFHFLPCLTWISRGVAKQVPDKVSLNKEEIQKVISETRTSHGGLEADDDDGGEKLEDSNVQMDVVEKPGVGKSLVTDEDDGDELKKYDLDNYDDEGTSDISLPGLGSLTYYASNDEDPYITLKNDPDDDDEEDFNIKPTDNLILVGHVERDNNNLDIYVYNAEEGHLFIHHDIMLPSFPLCVEWLDFDPSENATGNFVAIGNMTPQIDIWDVDLVDSIEPAFTLMGKKKKKKTKKKSVDKPASNLLGHTDAVLTLAWNRRARHILASGSADFTVGLWDLEEGKMASQIQQHAEKVQTMQWHPFEQQSLLTGSCDSTAVIYDCRHPESSYKQWKFNGEVERVLWNHFNPFHFLVSTETGFVYYVDTRKDAPVFTLSAHNKAVTGMTLSNYVPGCLVTVSADKTAKIWDITDEKPHCVTERLLEMGELQCAAFSPDSPYVVSIGGEHAEVTVWDIREVAAVRSHFPAKETQTPQHLTNTSSLSENSLEVGMDGISDSEENKISVPSSKSLNKQKKKKVKKKR